MSVSSGSRFISVAEAARRLDVSPSTVWRWIDARKLPAERVGSRKIRIREADLDLVVKPARGDSSELASTAPGPFVFVPPTEEELETRREAFERIKEIRNRLSTYGITATEALEEADRERRERHESWVGLRR